MANFNLRFWWWTLTVLVLIFTFFGGAFSSSWANQFKESREKCGGHNACFIGEIRRNPDFAPSMVFLTLAVLLEILSLAIGKEIDKQNKENDEIYRLGHEKIRNDRLSLEEKNFVKEYNIEKIKKDIEKVKKEI